MTSGGNPKSKPDFGLPFLCFLLMVLCLLMDMAEIALFPLFLAIFTTHTAIQESREEE